MAQYHINNEGNAGSCRATKKPCPFGGWDDHYMSKAEAQKGYEKQQELLAIIGKGKVREHPLTDKALQSSLIYDGPTPQWMNKLSKDAEQTFGSTPEIIDTVELNGTTYAVVWNENSMEEGDYYIQKERGYHTSSLQYRDMKTGEIKGFVRVGYVSDNSVKRSFGDDDFSIYRSVQDRNGGVVLLDEETIEDPVNGKEYYYGKAPYNDSMDDETRIAAKRKLWARLYKYQKTVPEGFDKSQLMWGSAVNLTEEHAPLDEKQIDEEIAAIRPKYEEDHENFIKSHKNPVVDYTNLDDHLRGQGIATSMYVYAARKLGEKGRVLSSSGVQSDDGQGLWKRLVADPRLNIKVISRRYEKGNYSSTDQKLVMDFTNNQKA